MGLVIIGLFLIIIGVFGAISVKRNSKKRTAWAIGFVIMFALGVFLLARAVLEEKSL